MDQEEIDLFRVSDEVFARYSTLPNEQVQEPERFIFLCVWELEAQVNNGGFDQYYFNDTGCRAMDAVKALTALGTDRMANLVREANGLFGPTGPSLDRKTRQEQLMALPQSSNDRLNELDAEFYKYPDKLDRLLKDFVCRHRETFFAK